MKKILAAVVCSTTVFAFGETASSHGSLTTVFGSESQETKVASEILPQPEIDDGSQLEKIGNINFEKISEAAPTTNQAKSKPEELSVLDELEEIEANVITIDSEGEIVAPKKAEPAPQPAAERKPDTGIVRAPERTAQSEPEPVVQEAPSLSENVGAENAQTVAAESSKPVENPGPELSNADSVESAEIVPSRSVTIKNNQYLDIVYAGSGWAYIGENTPNKLMTFFGRKLGKGDTVFALRSKKPGTTLLHFYKNDNLTGEYIDDYLAVTVENESSLTGERVTAPNYADIVPAKPVRKLDDIVSEKPADVASQAAPAPSAAVPERNAAAQENAEPAKEDVAPVKGDVKTVIENTTGAALASNTPRAAESSSVRAETEIAKASNEASGTEVQNVNLLENAKKSFDAGQFEAALTQAQEYMSVDSDKEDEVLYLLGQIYESESSVKNIRSSIDSYDTLVKNFPASSLWQKANQRSIYLKRFYIDIR